MNPRPASSPVRRFLRGLANVALGLLLPCQLLLLWVVTREGPVELPGAVGRYLSDQGAELGLRLHARRYLLTPQRTLIAEDFAAEIEGLSGEVFTADRVEIGLRLTGTARGLASLRVVEGRLWCPASIARRAERTLLIDRLRCHLVREGRWWQANVSARAGRLTVDLAGTLPGGLFAAPTTAPTGPRRPPAESCAVILRQAESALAWPARTAGGWLSVVSTGRPEGGALLVASGTLANDWADEKLGLIRIAEPRLKAQLQLDAQGGLGSWNLDLAAQDLDGQGHQARGLVLAVAGQGIEPRLVHGTLRLHGVQSSGLAGVEARLDGSGDPTRPWHLDLRTAASQVDLAWRPTAGSGGEFRSAAATLALEDLRRFPLVRDALTKAGLGLEGRLLLADLRVVCDEGTWAIRSVAGRAAFSGLQALGITSDAIAPGRALPLTTEFHYDPAAQDFPLKLTAVNLAGIRGEALCATQDGGAYRLNLRGELAPGSLDGLLGDWWKELWKTFLLTARPHAVIEVEGRWGGPTHTTTRGAVLLQDFQYREAPFRSVEVRVDANPRRTWIGLRRLAGGTTVDDGQVDGAVSWDWANPLAAVGPCVHVEGNLQPWIAARLAGPELATTLRPLVMPPSRRLVVDVAPSAPGVLDVTATVHCDDPVVAWGVASAHLDLTVRSAAQQLGVVAELDLASGRAHLDLTGDVTRAPKVALRLKGCDPVKLSALLGQFSKTTAPPTSPPPARTAIAQLDLGFAGSIDLAHPTLLRGRGDFTLRDPELKKVRILGGLSRALEKVGVQATSYELDSARGTFGCLDGIAYFPDLLLTGAQAELKLVGEVDLNGPSVNFLGDFTLPSKGSLNPLEILNLNRALVAMTKIRVKGPLSDPNTSALPRLKDILKYNEDKDLGKIPPSLRE